MQASHICDQHIPLQRRRLTNNTSFVIPMPMPDEPPPESILGLQNGTLASIRYSFTKSLYAAETGDHGSEILNSCKGYGKKLVLVTDS